MFETSQELADHDVGARGAHTQPIVALLAHFHSLSQDERIGDSVGAVVNAGILALRARGRRYDAADLSWGGHEGVWILHFGAYGGHLVLAVGSLDDALESAAATLPIGFFCCPEMPEGYEDLTEEEQDRAYNAACVDLTYTESGYLPSWEWACTECESLGDALEWMLAWGAR